MSTCVDINISDQNVVRNRLLELHNYSRQQFNLPPVKTNECLEEFSLFWAEWNRLNKIHIHSNNTLYGENIAWRTDFSNYTVIQLVDVMYSQWSKELEYYHPGIYPNVTFNSNVDVGHLTQILWRDCEYIGCTLLGSNYDYFLTCNYWPPGNIIGERPY